tara:strand:- start:162 stop:725 length:564 start_codon:yes stop_codon:yes gene_type:complete
MRIISGKYRGKKILQPTDNETRPLKDLTKESIFNIIKHSNLIKIEIENSNILDLFSGVGSFGLECMSRGASNIVFYENYKNVIKILKRNISDLDSGVKTKIIEKNIFDINCFNNLNNEFEIIFIDPPFKEKNVFKLMDNIIKLKLLKDNGIFIIHRHKNENDLLPKEMNIFLEKSYGVSKIIFGNLI